MIIRDNCFTTIALAKCKLLNIYFKKMKKVKGTENIMQVTDDMYHLNGTKMSSNLTGAMLWWKQL